MQLHLALPSRVDRRLFTRVSTGIVVGGVIIFLILYLVNRAPVSFIPRPQVLGPRPPRLVGMIYGLFGPDALNKPMDVAVIGNRIYVSDTNNYRIQVFDYDGNFLFRFGKRGDGRGEFQFPYGIAGDAAGNVYVADLYQGHIQVFDPDGNFKRYFPAEKSPLKGPGDIFITQDKVYVTDINAGRVFVFDLAGKLLATIGKPGSGPGEFRAPNGVAVDAEGNVYVVDTMGARVEVFDPTGKFLYAFNGSPDGNGESVLLNPRGIGLRGGVVYVVSNLTHNVWGFDARTGKRHFAFGQLGSGMTDFMFPNGLFVDAQGRIYITDTANQRVAIYQ